MDLKDLVRATNAEMYNFRNMKISEISIDSRNLKAKNVFIAIKGNRFDGHNFIDKAIAKGAASVIVSRSIFKSRLKKYNKRRIPFLIVKNTIKALGDIAHYYRMQFNIPIVAVTGSTGKTTVKEIISHILASEFNVLKNDGTKNNLIGLPLTLLKLKDKHDIVVLEVGTNHFGEIKRLSEIAEPTVGVITNIGHAHLETFGSIGQVFKEKAALLNSLTRNGWAVLNKDDKCLANVKTVSKKIYFGIEKNCKFQGKHISKTQKGYSFKLGKKTFKVPLLGKHSIYNALTGITVGRLFRMKLEKIASRLEKFKMPLVDRFTLSKINNIHVINDTYNSNPLSFSAAVKSLVEMKPRTRKVLVSSDMLELGKKAIYFHKEAGKMVARSGIDMLLTVGVLSKFMNQSAKCHGMDKARALHFKTRSQLNSMLPSIIQRGDVVLVKGSRTTHMEEVVDQLNRKT